MSSIQYWIIIYQSFHHFKLQCQWSYPEKWGGECLLPLFQFWVLESELISSNSLFFSNFICTSITVETVTTILIVYERDYWTNYFAYFIIATHLLFQTNCNYYTLLFLLSVVSFYKKTFISLSNINKPSLKKLFIVGFLFSYNLKIIPNYCLRCISTRCYQCLQFPNKNFRCAFQKSSKHFISHMWQ